MWKGWGYKGREGQARGVSSNCQSSETPRPQLRKTKTCLKCEPGWRSPPTSTLLHQKGCHNGTAASAAWHCGRTPGGLKGRVDHLTQRRARPMWPRGDLVYSWVSGVRVGRNHCRADPGTPGDPSQPFIVVDSTWISPGQVAARCACGVLSFPEQLDAITSMFASAIIFRLPSIPSP